MEQQIVIIATKKEHDAYIVRNAATCGTCKYWRQDGVAYGGIHGTCAIRLYKAGSGALLNINTETYCTCVRHENKNSEVK